MLTPVIEATSVDHAERACQRHPANGTHARIPGPHLTMGGGSSLVCRCSVLYMDSIWSRVKQHRTSVCAERGTHSVGISLRVLEQMDMRLGNICASITEQTLSCSANAQTEVVRSARTFAGRLSAWPSRNQGQASFSVDFTI